MPLLANATIRIVSHTIVCPACERKQTLTDQAHHIRTLGCALRGLKPHCDYCFDQLASAERYRKQ